MIRIAEQVSRAIRILRGNRDESARASHLVVEKDLLMTYESAFFDQAEREKCSQSTFSERKIMSTKTAFKRVALVAAAALAIGGVSAVSANAATSGGTVSVSAATATVRIGDAATTTATFGFTSSATTDVGTLTAALTKPTGSTSAVVLSAATATTTGDTVVQTSSTVTTLTAAGWVASTHTTATATNTVTVTPDLVGTYVVTLTNNVGAVAATFTITAVNGPKVARSFVSTTATAITGTYVPETFLAGSTDHYYTITSTGVGSVVYPATITTGTGTLTAVGTSEIWSNGAGAIGAGSTFALTDSVIASVYSAVAGTQVVTITGDVTSAITLTITWGAAPVVSAANSIVAANNATDIAGAAKTTVATEDTSVASVFTVNQLGGGAYVLLNNNASTPAAVTTDVLSASVSGPGILRIGSTYNIAAAATGGRSVSNAAAGSTAYVLVYGDGTSGIATVTVTDSTAGVVLGTFTVTFYSTTIAKLVATTNTNVPVAAVAGFTPTATEGINGSAVTTGGAPVSVVATDANGNAIPSAAGITVTSGTTSVATVGAVTYDATNGYSYVNIVPVAEGKTVITFSDTATGLVTATATLLVTTAVASKVGASTDAATYDPGTKVVYTLTATDAAGNPVADGTYAGLLTTAPVSNVGLQGALPAPVTGATVTNVTFAGGVANYNLYAPLSTANVAISGGVISATAATVATALQGATLAEADFATTGSSDTAANAATDAANEATDAANAATDAANAAADSADAATQAAQDAGDKADAALAAVTALSQQVTTLLSKVAALATAIAKITKKLKA